MAEIFRHFGEMCWPAPGEELRNIEWRLRHASTDPDRLVAASILQAYAELIALPASRRNLIIAELRKGPSFCLFPDAPGEPT